MGKHRSIHQVKPSAAFHWCRAVATFGAPHSLITTCFPIPCWQAVHPDIQSHGNLHQSFLISVLSRVLSTRCAETGQPMWRSKYVTTNHKIDKTVIGTKDMVTFLMWKSCSFVLKWHIAVSHVIYIIPINIQLPDCSWIRNQIPYKRFRQLGLYLVSL